MIVIKILSVLVLIYGIIALILKSRNLPFALPATIFGALMVVLSTIIIKIDAQNVGVLVKPTGVDKDVLHTGWHLVAWWNNVYTMDKTVWVYTCSHNPKEGQKADADAIWSPTKDGIKMGFDVSVSWKIIPNEANWIYSNVSENDGGNSGRYLWLEENVIRPKLKSALALTVSNYTPIEVYSVKRQAIQDEIISRMRAEVKQYKLLIDQVDLREVFYSPEFEKSINEKKLAEQAYLTLIEVTKQKEELLKQATINKDIAIQLAEGEAKALQIKGTSIASNPKIIELEWIRAWDGKLPQYMMGSGQGVMLNLNNK